MEFVRRGRLDVVLNPEVMRTGQPATRVQTVSDGRKLILEANPVFDAQGKLVLCITFLRDVTMLSEMREQMSVPEGTARSVPAAQYRRGRTGAFPQDAEAVHQQCHDQALRRGEHHCGDGRHGPAAR